MKKTTKKVLLWGGGILLGLFGLSYWALAPKEVTSGPFTFVKANRYRITVQFAPEDAEKVLAHIGLLAQEPAMDFELLETGPTHAVYEIWALEDSTVNLPHTQEDADGVIATMVSVAKLPSFLLDGE